MTQQTQIRALEILGWKWRNCRSGGCRILLPDEHWALEHCYDTPPRLELPIAGDQAQYLIDFIKGDAFLLLVNYASNKGWQFHCESPSSKAEWMASFWQDNQRTPHYAETLQSAVLSAFLKTFDNQHPSSND